MARFPFFRQHDNMDCGPACLRMIARFYGKHYNLKTLQEKSAYSKRTGVSLFGISQAAETIGLKSATVNINLETLLNEVTLPCIVHWRQSHFVVVTPKSNKRKVVIADPANGILTFTRAEFESNWLATPETSDNKGAALLLEPTQRFYEMEGEKGGTLTWGSLLQQLFKHKRYLVQVFFALVIGSILQLIIPFLTQSIVDTGINTRNLNFIYVILAAQFMLLLSRTVVDFIRSRILLHISTNINLTILSDFWRKLMRLPASFFDTKMTGDIMQRIGDYRRIESFLTGSTISMLFSTLNLLIYSLVMLTYSIQVFSIFLAGSILYFVWIKIFMKRRRKLDNTRFQTSARSNSSTMQLIQGMHEIKLNTAEQPMRRKWEGVQSSMFLLNLKGLILNQYQQAGAIFINEGKNGLVTFFVAKAVIEGHLTLGAMLAVQYIIGMLNSPIEQLISFSQQAQDAKISLERLNEIHAMEDEEPDEKTYLKELPTTRSISINNLTFAYNTKQILNNISLYIPDKKITAIIGMSGSGKTTLLKLLLKFYENYSGEIRAGEYNLKSMSARFWRMNCGSVLQDGFIFSDTIERNVVIGDEPVDHKRLLYACETANILSFIESLPNGFNTKIGAEGQGISAGQKQRILIARAVYKDPEYLFLDEATNSLDANNEHAIMNNLQTFFKNKTVVIVAHRLSTVKNADNIIVMENGIITEQGNHEALSLKKGKYYELVKNQLELGN